MKKHEMLSHRDRERERERARERERERERECAVFANRSIIYQSGSYNI